MDIKKIIDIYGSEIGHVKCIDMYYQSFKTNAIFGCKKNLVKWDLSFCYFIRRGGRLNFIYKFEYQQ